MQVISSTGLPVQVLLHLVIFMSVYVKNIVYAKKICRWREVTGAVVTVVFTVLLFKLQINFSTYPKINYCVLVCGPKGYYTDCSRSIAQHILWCIMKGSSKHIVGHCDAVTSEGTDYGYH